MRPTTAALLAPLTLLLTLTPGPALAADRLVTLRQAYRMALQTNPTIQLLRERVEQAKASRYKAWSSVKPSASYQGTFNIYDQEVTLTIPDLTNPSATPTTVVFQKQFMWSHSLAAKMPLFVGPAYPAISMARKQVDLAKMTEVRSRQDFLLLVANAYYRVVSQKEIVRALQNKVTLDEKNLSAAKARFEVGQDTRASVMRADLVATQDRQSLRTATNVQIAYRRQLAIYLGLSGTVDVERPAEPRIPKGSARSMLSTALVKRMDYQATALSIELAEDGKQADWWQFAPIVDASFLYRWSEATNFQGDNDVWYFTFNFTVPIYDGGTRYADLRSSDSRIRSATEQRRALAMDIENDVVKLRADLESAEAGVISARKALKLAKVTSEDMQAAYEVGQTTQLDVLDASQRLLDAEIGVTRSLFARDLARLALSHAMGTFDPSRKGR
jgi:outer membrane protein